MYWSLKTLYDSFTDEKFTSDFKNIQDQTTTLLALFDPQSMHSLQPEVVLKTFITTYNELVDTLHVLYSFAQLTNSVDTNNSEASKWIEQIQGIFPKLTLVEVKFQKFLLQLENKDEIITSDPLLNTHRFFIEEQLKKATHLLSESEEEVIAIMKNTGSNAWAKLKDTVTSNLMVDFYEDGQNVALPLSVIRNYAHEHDAFKRRNAYFAELKAYEKIDKSVAAALNGVKGEVIAIAQRRKYDSPLAMTLESSRMDQQTLDAMIVAMEEYLPAFRSYLKKKATLLNHTEGLPFYDLFAPLGSVQMTYTYSEAQSFIIEQFSKFSPKLGNYAKNAFESQWVDAKMREGKVGGAFCDNLHKLGESRIMANFSGSFNDVTTLAHELGHGYHGDCLNQATALNADYPMPLAETASIFCETIVINAALKDASKEEAFVILENELMSATQVVVDIYSRYLFETELFESRKNGSLSVDELNESMKKAQLAAYGDSLDPAYLHPYMWACKPHYYYADSNFYNFPYAFGLLFAKGLYAKYLEEGNTFLEKYDNLLELTGKEDIHTVLASIGVDSHNPDFFRNSLEIIKKNIDQFVSA